MKKLIAIILISAVFVSCKKDSTTPTTPTPAAAGSFTCTINGAAFTADSAHYNIGGPGNPTNIFAFKNISGAASQFFEINLNGQTATTYAFPPNSLAYLAGGSLYSATSGSLTISTYDMTNRKISGTFTGVTAGSVTITNGVFTNLPYK